MRTKLRSLPDSLSKPINPANAPARGLRMHFCFPPDKSDERAYVVEETARRIKIFDQEHGLDRNAPDLDERRAKAIVERLFGIPTDASNWWRKLGLTLMIKFVPGFSKSKRGRPRTWHLADYADLYYDVKTTKARSPELRGTELYKAVQTRNQRWAKYGIAALRKAYAQAQAISRAYPKPPLAS